LDQTVDLFLGGQATIGNNVAFLGTQKKRPRHCCIISTTGPLSDDSLVVLDAMPSEHASGIRIQKGLNGEFPSRTNVVGTEAKAVRAFLM